MEKEIQKKDIVDVVDLRNHLLKTLEDLRDGKINYRQARATASLSNSAIDTVKVEIVNANLRAEMPKIKFLER